MHRCGMCGDERRKPVSAKTAFLRCQWCMGVRQGHRGWQAPLAAEGGCLVSAHCTEHACILLCRPRFQAPPGRDAASLYRSQVATASLLWCIACPLLHVTAPLLRLVAVLGRCLLVFAFCGCSASWHAWSTSSRPEPSSLPTGCEHGLYAAR